MSNVVALVVSAAIAIIAARAARMAVGCKLTLGAMKTAATLSNSTIAMIVNAARFT